MEGNSAIQYSVIINNPRTSVGHIRFEDEMRMKLSKQTLKDSTDFIWKLLKLTKEIDRKYLRNISLIVEDIEGAAHTEGNIIHISTKYIENYSKDLRREVIGILYHEMTHAWQWNGNGQTPGGLIDGIANFASLKADYEPSHWVKPGQGENWDQGYDVTARFLDYCNDLRNGFVAELNKKIRSGYRDEYFVELLGKPVDQVWREYKTRYAK